jgi:hypothetical protein
MTYRVSEKYLSIMERVYAKVMVKSISNVLFMVTRTKVGVRILMRIFSSALLVESRAIRYKSLRNKKG